MVHGIGQFLLAWNIATIIFGLAGPVLLKWIGPGAIGHDLAPAVVVSLLMLFALGGLDMVSVYVRQSLIQLYTPDAMRGRLQGVFIVVVAGGPRLGDVESGVVAHAFGERVSIVSGGLLCILGVIVLSMLYPTFRRFGCGAAW